MLLLFQDTATVFEGWTWPGVILAIASSAVTVVASLALLITSVKTIREDGFKEFLRRVRFFKARREARAAQLKQIEIVVQSSKDLREAVTEILKEVKPNGGESLKDRIVNIDNKVENIVARNRHDDETSDLAIFKLDNRGEMTFANSAFREMVNAEDAQLEHNNYLSLMDDDSRRRFVRSRDEAIQFKMPLDAIVKFKVHGPHLVEVRMQASPDVRHGGELKAFFGTAVKVEAPPAQ